MKSSSKKAVGLIAAALLMPMVAFGAAVGRPNSLIILADDLGYADLGFQGSKDIPRRISIRWRGTVSAARAATCRR